MMPRPGRSPTNLSRLEHVARVEELADRIESGKRVDWPYVARHYKIHKRNAVRWVDRAKRAVARRRATPEALRLLAAMARGELMNFALREVDDAAA
jgi:hypothetical protein